MNKNRACLEKNVEKLNIGITKIKLAKRKIF